MTVTHRKAVCRLQAARGRRQSPLVASVSLLADCLDGAGAASNPPQASTHREVAKLAVVAALDAERRLAEQTRRIATLERLAVTDPLTGLLNRRGFEDALHRVLAAAGRYDERGALVSLDLDGFKFVNDAYGHAAGDEVLRQVARVLLGGVRASDRVGRIGGDEFAVLMPRIAPVDGRRRADALDARLNDTVVGWQGLMIALKASFGTQIYGGGDDGRTLLSRADAVMYAAKRSHARSDRTGPQATG